MSPNIWHQYLLFLVCFVASVGLLVGLRTRLSAAVCWLFVSGCADCAMEMRRCADWWCRLHVRNPLLLHTGDTMLRQALLWGTVLGPQLSESWCGARAMSSLRSLLLSQVT